MTSTSVSARAVPISNSRVPSPTALIALPDRVLLARCWIVAFVVRNPDRLRQTKGSSQVDPSRRSEFSAHSPLRNRIRNVIRNLEEMYGKSPDLVGAAN